jgi:hypothetical protein
MPVSPGFILPFCRYRPVQADAGLPVWSSLPTELESVWNLMVLKEIKRFKTQMKEPQQSLNTKVQSKIKKKYNTDSCSSR